jgi:hypothetical protein
MKGLLGATAVLAASAMLMPDLAPIRGVYHAHSTLNTKQHKHRSKRNKMAKQSRKANRK